MSAALYYNYSTSSAQVERFAETLDVELEKRGKEPINLSVSQMAFAEPERTVDKDMLVSQMGAGESGAIVAADNPWLTDVDKQDRDSSKKMSLRHVQ